MRLIGCDLHASQQSIAMLDGDTGEIVEKTLAPAPSPTSTRTKSVGALSVYVEGDRPDEIPFLFEPSQKQIAHAAAASFVRPS
jgi:hypothetical protein